jgi:hypothetical protein
MALRYLTSQEKEMIAVGLNMRKCYIETGSTTLGASDVARMDPKQARRAYGAEIKALSEDQMKLILATNELERKIYSDGMFINDEEKPTVRRQP